MKASELSEKSVEELQAALGGELKVTRRNIARIKTAMNQKAGE
jgi:ribosomal protein L29